MDALGVTGSCELNTHNKAPFLRRRLGRRLRSMRESAGLNLDEAAERLDKKRSALHRIETGVTKADVHFVRSAMDIYDVYDPDLLDQTREAAKPGWFRAYGITVPGYIDVETFAVKVQEFSGLVLPGLLQTEAYIRALFSKGLFRDEQELDNGVRVRLLRQKRLLDPSNPLELVAVVDEGSLRREVGGVEVMRAQLRHMIEAADLPTVTLQVIPLSAGSHSSMDGSLVLLSFPEPEDPDMLYIEHAVGALQIEDEGEVRVAASKFEALRSQALSPADSVVFMEELLGELARGKGVLRGSVGPHVA